MRLLSIFDGKNNQRNNDDIWFAVRIFQTKPDFSQVPTQIFIPRFLADKKLKLQADDNMRRLLSLVRQLGIPACGERALGI
jgi:hypothetical protein